jgi:heme/copper-type cytochrome/quinol oxidase subunit 1
MSLARCTFWACKECHGDTYLLEMGWGLNVFTSATRGQAATANPWDAGTLEWATEILTNFSRIPFVTHGEPLWDNRNDVPVVPGLDVDSRQLITGTITEALP